MKKIYSCVLMLCMSATAMAQSLDGTWLGKLQVGPQALTIVFHFSGKTCNMDVTEQGAKGIPAEVR